MRLFGLQVALLVKPSRLLGAGAGTATLKVVVPVPAVQSQILQVLVQLLRERGRLPEPGL